GGATNSAARGLKWTCGTLRGGADPVAPTSAGTRSIPRFILKTWRPPRSTLYPYPTLFRSSGNIDFGAGAIFNNTSGATFNIQNDALMRSGVKPTDTPINNAGLCKKTAGSGQTIIGYQNPWPFTNNGGTITIATGSMRFDGA